MKINLHLIKEKRKSLGFTINQMSEFLGLSDSSQYWKREKGHYNFKVDELSALSEKLNIPFNDLFLSHSISKTEIEQKEQEVS
ncbi:helix-turn-helix domain-containing protein [Piscibacillus salipiscarius]|uniref:Helix-turn-helix domain-containing protein n=1 Tax=Piscibacillus salipiscarius TaxID=299480 RepID=A0ABW5Q6X1_9BACI